MRLCVACFSVPISGEESNCPNKASLNSSELMFSESENPSYLCGVFSFSLCLDMIEWYCSSSLLFNVEIVWIFRAHCGSRVQGRRKDLNFCPFLFQTDVWHSLPPPCFRRIFLLHPIRIIYLLILFPYIEAVFQELGYTCSAGLSHNRKFAKLISSDNKPNGQTILPTRGLNHLLSTVSFRKLQGFGGKLGDKMASLFDVETFQDITTKIPLPILVKNFGEEV